MRALREEARKPCIRLGDGIGSRDSDRIEALRACGLS